MANLSIQPILNQHWIRAPLKGVTAITVVFIFNGLIDILILYVFANLPFIQADCTYIVATSPEAVTFKIPLQPAVFFKHNHSTLAFEVAHDGLY